MKRAGFLLALALMSIPVSGCVGYGMGVGRTSQSYHVWYDGYYGPFYDGYWGTDGYFYFRLRDSDRTYRRGDDGHFRRGDVRPSPNFTPHQGYSKQPARGTRMPNYPRAGEPAQRR